MTKYPGLDGQPMEPITEHPWWQPVGAKSRSWWDDKSVPNRIHEIYQVAEAWRASGDTAKADFLERAIGLQAATSYRDGYEAGKDEEEDRLWNGEGYGAE